MFEKLANYNPQSAEDRAYLHGFQTKLAEHDITLEEFFDYAEKTAFWGTLGKSFKALGNVPGAAKNWWNSRGMARGLTDDSARAMQHADNYANTAGKQRSLALNQQANAEEYVDSGANTFARGAQQKAVKSRRKAQLADRASGRLRTEGNELAQRADIGRQMANQQFKGQLKQTLPAVGTLGVGGGAVAFGAGDANTTSNQMRRWSNETIGTDFDTQSRFGAMFG